MKRWHKGLLVFSVLLILIAFFVKHEKTAGQKQIEKITWHACQSNPKFKCGSFDVPLDYQDKYLGNITLPAIYIPATGKAFGTLYFNSGGPWGDFVNHVQRFYKGRMPEVIKQHFNIVTFNPRTVKPNQSDCQSEDMLVLDEVQEQIIKTYPGDSAGANKIYDLIDKKHELCHYPVITRYASTKNTARDLNYFRELLGVKKLNFYVASYGTRLGLAYLLKYPQHVGDMIMDGNMAPTNNFMDIYHSRAAGVENNIKGFFELCVQAKERCALYHETSAAQMIGDFKKIKFNSKFSKAQFDILLSIDMENSSTWPQLAKALNQAIVDNDTDLLEQQFKKAVPIYEAKTDQYDLKSVTDVNAAVLCVDYQRSNSRETILNQVSQIQKANPLLGGSALTDKALRCVNWPIAPEPLLPEQLAQSFKTTAKILLIGNRYDPATPYPDTMALLKYLKQLNVNVNLVTWGGVGHTAILDNSPIDGCVYQSVDKFLSGEKLHAFDYCDDGVDPFLAGK